MHHLSRSELNQFPKPATVLRNSVWMFGSRSLRALVAAVYFTLLARSLGVTGYGAFVGVCAMAGILSPFASLGTGNLLIRDVARNRETFSARWGNCLVITCLSGSLFTCIAVSIARVVLPPTLPLLLVLSIAVADLLFVRLLDVSAMAFQALEQLHMTAWFSLALTVSRMIAAAVLLLACPHATPRQWSALYLVSTAIPAMAALGAVTKQIGLPSFLTANRPKDLLQGFYFSISMAAQTIYNDIDKTMLARISGLGAAGVYSAAYRIVDATFTPVGAVLAATYAKFFQHGAEGLHRSARFGRRILIRAVIYSLLSGAGLWFVAPYVPHVIGDQFADSVIVLRMLSPLLLLRSLHSSAADSLTGAGYQGTRTLLQVVVAAANVALNLIFIPRHSWRGAVGTTLASDGSLALLLWIAVWILCARERQTITDVSQRQSEAVQA